MKKKKDWLDLLYNEIGKQATNFRLTCGRIENGQPIFDKWVPYLKAREDRKIISRCNQREQLKNEIVLDYDKGNKRDYLQLIKRVEKDGKKLYAYMTKEGRARQISLYYKGLASMKRTDREEYRERVIQKYGCDPQFRSDKHMVPIEYVKHWKTKQVKELVKEVPGFNELDLQSEMPEQEPGKDEKKSQAQILVELAEQNSKLFTDQYKEPYAAIENNNHIEIHAVNCKFFKRWISKIYYELERKVPNSNTISSALNLISAKACFAGKQIELHNRVAWHHGALYYDLTDEKWRVIRIDETGWEIIDRPPILFKRYSHQRAQVEPKEKGDIQKIEDFLNINTSADMQLFKINLITCLIPGIPHVIPISYGPQGSAKSTAFKLIRTLIDPSLTEVLGAPKDYKELVQLLSHHWCCFFDNVTYLQEWFSNALCKAVTGDGFSKRQLYTDDDDIIYAFKRCIGLNGINVPATRPDLLDRSMLLPLDRITKKNRMTERKFWARFNKLKPEILGDIFNTISQAIRIKNELELKEHPRMADFAEWGEAVSLALGYEPDSFVKNFDLNLNKQNEEAIEGHVIGPAVLELVKDKTFKGTASELLIELESIAEDLKINTKVKHWPKAPHVLTKRLKEIKSNLQDANIEIIFNRGGKMGARTIEISNITDKASEPSEPSVKEEKVLDEADATDTTDASNVIFRSPSSPTDEMLIQMVYESEPKGYDMQLFADKWSEKRMQKMIKHGPIYEKKPGFLGVLQ